MSRNKDHRFNVCQNRGNARIWIEGQRLLDAGFEHGDLFVLKEQAHRLVLVFDAKVVAEAKPSQRRKVAGAALRPIIDINNKVCTRFFGSSKTYVATFCKRSRKIEITV